MLTEFEIFIQILITCYLLKESVNNMKATSPVTSHNIKPIVSYLIKLK